MTLTPLLRSAADAADEATVTPAAASAAASVVAYAFLAVQEWRSSPPDVADVVHDGDANVGGQEFTVLRVPPPVDVE